MRVEINQGDWDVYKGKQWQWQEGEYLVTRTTQWSAPGCHNGCGVLFYTKGNKLCKIEGDPNLPFNQGRLCMRCLDMVEMVNHPDRVLYPMYRDPKDRGKDAFRRISWDEAIDIIEENANRIKEQYGPESIITMGGTGRNTTWQMPVMAKNCFGSPNDSGGFLSGEACYVPRMAAMNALMGCTAIMDCAQMVEARYDDPGYVVPEVCLLWGNHAIKSNPDGFLGHWIVHLMQRGTKLISIDPRLNWMNAKSEIWIQIRPGTDTAFALALLNVIIEEDLYDHDFVDKWTYGFDALAERVKEYPPEKVAEICWCKPDDIVRVARRYAAAKPAAIQWGLAVDQAKYGVETAHAILCLWSITGNVDIPGGNIVTEKGYVQADIRAAMAMDLPEELREKRLGDEKYLYRKLTYGGHALSDAALEALETNEPYPVKMIVLGGANPIANQGADNKRVYHAMMNAEFVVANDCFITPTIAAVCDMVLPVAMSIERNAIRGWWQPLRAISKVIQTGECKSDEEIVVALGRRLNPEGFPWKTDVEFLDHVMSNLSSVTYDGDFKDLCEKGYYYDEWHYRKHELGLLRKDGQPGFNTPTGRIELYSTTFEMFGLDPLPYYKEPTHSPVSTPELMEEYPFVLTTGQRSWEYFHSENRQMKNLRAFHPDPMVEINDEDAESLGLVDGDWAVLENYQGHARFKVKVNPGLLKGVVAAEHGWWFPERGIEDLFGTFESNANCLTTQCDNGPHGYGAPYKNQLCKVYKETEEYHRAMLEMRKPGEAVKI